MPRLGVNIDHVATVRQARGGRLPDPVHAAVLAELAGADGITLHLREDRRHVQERDLRLIRSTVSIPTNLELAVHPEVVRIATEVRPQKACLVPERREELTTEGGLDVVAGRERIAEVTAELAAAGVEVYLFVDPDPVQLDAAAGTGAVGVEIHTGRYADAPCEADRIRELEMVRVAVNVARGLGLNVNAGHGLDYRNVSPIAALEGVGELNIGHAIVARSILVGIGQAVREMKELAAGPREPAPAAGDRAF